MFKKNIKYFQAETITPGHRTFFQCCPNNINRHIIRHSSLNKTNDKKGKKFIKMTLASTKTSQNSSLNQLNVSVKQKTQNKYQNDKYTFLQSLRKFNPNPQHQKQQFSSQNSQNSFQRLDNILYNDQQNGDNILSSLLDNLSNQMFSQMLISKSVRHKIQYRSRQLKMITQVKSQMQMSYKSSSSLRDYLSIKSVSQQSN